MNTEIFNLLPDFSQTIAIFTGIFFLRVYKYVKENQKPTGEQVSNKNFGKLIIVILGEFFLATVIFCLYSLPSSDLNLRTCFTIGVGCLKICEKLIDGINQNSSADTIEPI